MIAILITVAFVCGLLARLIGLPPLIGFLAAGFIMRAAGVDAFPDIEKLGDFGVTLLLFTIGLKLKVKDLVKSEVWAGTSLHMLGTVVFFAVFLYAGKLLGLPILSELNVMTCVLAGFALSFSSTVFAVKSLEDKAQLAALHGTVAIGMLIMQDIIAVVFLAVSTGKIPTVWALTLVLLIPLRYVIGKVLDRTGHGELLILLGFFLALGIYGWFDAVGVKGDLGAIILGMMLASHPKSHELSKTLFGFKDVFLVAFFLSIGLSADLTMSAVGIALLLMIPLALKVVLYAFTLIRFHLRPRSAILTSLALANYSEFGLIVGSIAVANGWLGNEWLVIIAVAVAVSFVIASPLNKKANDVADKVQSLLQRFETGRFHEAERPIDLAGVNVVIFGVGGVGRGAYDYYTEHTDMKVCGFDSCPDVVAKNVAAGRLVYQGDGTDINLLHRLENRDEVQLVLLAMADHRANLSVARVMGPRRSDVKVSATAKHDDEEAELKTLGVDAVYNFHAGAGAGFASNSNLLLETERG
ncbi:MULTISPECIES: cation:proton antiporter [unclassified Lentimonas]|uniref:cation:proton antiporter domain-containing protein n=1 Tax=unclassified Lentimonas TaxID=2630993 RepID=UPI00132BBE1E|nr:MULTISPECIES: cation:proton antiporter [unclassified Lentimonas]CAA6693243.1 putative Glutathione-regulated potassium-efflux system protein KefB [Lentimonas sp. CC10]CAA6695476.1 putative Glutathione-regulated potassium-efflux system protein KefB [Lentimonas sp. CC19]CAA7071757.1 putative Glutathione-regulated potassium-efflux system protein KefB [Lentimonas sp. CC11]